MDTSPISSKPDISQEELRELIGEVRDLERRVSALERSEPKPALEAYPHAAVPEVHVSTDTVPAIGRALLAIAGAYLLRALTELHAVPVGAGVSAGILYAAFWLWHATRAKGKLAATVYAISSIFIFVPLIWEATVGLHAVSSWTAAAIIAVFSIAALSDARVGIWSCSVGAAIAVGLLAASHDLLPFTAALLAIGAGAEFALIGTRWFTSICADSAILILTLILSRTGGLPEGYAPVPLPAALAMLGGLFVIYIWNALAQTLARRREFTVYEIGQTVCAFALASGGALYLTKAAAPIGVFAVLCGIACYGIAFSRRSPARNVPVYAAFGLLLLLAGTFLLVSGDLRIALWAALAVGLTSTAFAKVQVPFLLWLAMAISGVAGSAGSQLFAPTGEAFPYRAAMLILAAAAVSYFATMRTGSRGSSLLIAASLISCASGMAAAPGAGVIMLMALAIALAWSGERWDRAELIWLMYGLMTLAGVKILFRDFSRESTMTLMVSLICYGAALILVPRILRKSG